MTLRDRRLGSSTSAGGLVVAEAEVGRVAEPPVVRPLGESDLRDEPRLDPLQSAADARQFGASANGDVSRRSGSSRPAAADLGVVEAGADVADVAQRPPSFTAEDERAEACSARRPVPRV